jgi:signal transduction histidine kinase
MGVTYYLPDDFPGTRIALESGEPILTYVDDPTVPAVKRQHLQSFNGYTSLIIPLQVGGKTIAYAEVWESQQRRTFTPSEIQLCQDIAYHAALALENARLFKVIADERGRLQALIESDRDGIILISETGQVLVMNEPARAFLELAEPLEQWIHQSVPDIFEYLAEKLPIVAQIAAEEQARLRQGDTQPHEGEFDLPSRSVHWRSLPVMVEGQASNRLIVLRDITEERHLEQMRQDLIHTMVHDLRNPLSSISITLDLLGMYMSGVTEEKINRTLARARSSTIHMLAMVNQILDINRLESGRLDLAYQSVTFSSIINPVLEMETPLALENNIQVLQDISPDLPLVRVDAALVERVLQNLLGNAIKFTPPEGTIRIKAEVQDHCLFVSVIDTGKGIPQGVYGRLFQKFSTGDQQQRGSGLGLAFCKMAIEAHNQHIWVAETSANGTTFQFTLPLAPSNQS